MPTPPLSDEDLQKAVAARAQHATITEAAAALGMPWGTLKNRLARAAERGLMGYEPVLPGFAIRQVTTKAADGTVIQQRKEAGKQYKPTDGLALRGKTTWTNAEGRITQQVHMERADSAAREVTREAIEAAFAAYGGHAVLPPTPAYTNADLLTVYPIVDLHLGLYAWGRETGADYDLKIAADLLKRSVANLVARSANSSSAIVLDLGDYFHADDSRNQTKRSGNPLDVDSRYARVLQVGVELAVECIELALQKHDRVLYRKLPGNHDDETSLMLAIALAAWFRNNPRVTVDTDPSRFFMHRHGTVMIAATHGDMLKMGDMAGFMAANWPREWGATEHRYAYTGHVHHDRLKSGGGVRAESFNTLAAKDAWHAASGYVSPRSAVAITMHRDHGEIDRLTVNLPRAPIAAANDNEPMKEAA